MNQTAEEFYQGESGEKYYKAKFHPAMNVGRIYQLRYFQPHAQPDLDLLDFGCSNGLSLRSLPAKSRTGIEVNPLAIEEGQKMATDEGVEIDFHQSLSDVADQSKDLVISNHCLEHVPHPLDSLQQIFRKLRDGGKLVIVVPFDDWRMRKNRVWKNEDPDMHLFSWSPMNLGNLLTLAGFEVQSAQCISQAWTPKIFFVRKYFGLTAFKMACWVVSFLTNRREVVCIANKPKAHK